MHPSTLLAPVDTLDREVHKLEKTISLPPSETWPTKVISSNNAIKLFTTLLENPFSHATSLTFFISWPL